jgi:hypothetical protein
MEISSTFWVPDITNCWCQQEDMYSKSTNISDAAHKIFSILPHGVRVEASFLIARDVICWRQSKSSGEMLGEEVVLKQFSIAYNRILVHDYTALDSIETELKLALKRDAETRKLH